jgi:hypothetical protein
MGKEKIGNNYFPLCIGLQRNLVPQLIGKPDIRNMMPDRIRKPFAILFPCNHRIIKIPPRHVDGCLAGFLHDQVTGDRDQQGNKNSNQRFLTQTKSFTDKKTTACGQWLFQIFYVRPAIRYSTPGFFASG